MPQDGPNTQYAELRWGELADLVPAARAGLALLARAAAGPRSGLEPVSPRPGLLARGPWRPDQVEAVWREDAYEPPAEVDRMADGAVEGLRERGSPAHDGMATRLVGVGRRRRPPPARAPAGALGAAAARRRLRQPHRALRGALGGRPLARGPPRRLGVELGGPLGARRGRRRRPRREPRGDAHPRASGGVAAAARRPVGRGARVPAERAQHARRRWPPSRTTASPCPTTSTTSGPGGRPTPPTGRPRRTTASS